MALSSFHLLLYNQDSCYVSKSHESIFSTLSNSIYFDFSFHSRLLFAGCRKCIKHNNFVTICNMFCATQMENPCAPSVRPPGTLICRLIVNYGFDHFVWLPTFEWASFFMAASLFFLLCWQAATIFQAGSWHCVIVYLNAGSCRSGNVGL